MSSFVPWLEEELKLVEYYKELTNNEIYDRYKQRFGEKRSKNAIKKKARQLRIDEDNGLMAIGRPLTLDDFLDEPEENDPIDILLNPKQVKERIKIWLSSLANVFDQCYKPIQPHKAKSSSKPALNIFLSDNHFGKQTDTFNIEVAKKRIASIPYMIQQEPIPPFDCIHLILGGDNVEGEDIYATQNGVVEAPVIIQTKEAANSLWSLILALRATFKVPVIVDDILGNHGRMSKTASIISNWDNAVSMILYMLAQERGDKDIVVNLNFREFPTISIKDKKIGLYHKGVKHTGTPAMQVKIAGWKILKEIDALLSGHWHQWSVGTYLGMPIIANGSLSGADDLAEVIAKGEPPRQAYFLVYENVPIKHFSFLEW